VGVGVPLYSPLVRAAVVALDEADVALRAGLAAVDDHVAILRRHQFLLERVEERGIVQVAPADDPELGVTLESCAAAGGSGEHGGAARGAAQCRGPRVLVTDGAASDGGGDGSHL